MLALAVVVSSLSGCALVSTCVEAPGIDIDKPSTLTARVVSAHLWRDGQQLSLRGQVVSIPVSRSRLRGHLDIAIARPDREDITCLTTRPMFGARHTRKYYSVDVDEMPPPASQIRVWHHPTQQHESCDESLLTSKLHANGLTSTRSANSVERGSSSSEPT